MKFKTKVQLEGKTATGFDVPETVVEALNSGKRIPVVVTINGYSYRSTVVKYNGRFMLPLAAENREGAGVEAGDEIEVQLEVDTAPRVVEVPEYIADIFRKEGLTEAFVALSYTHQKEHVRAIEDAKTEETRQRRLEKAIEMIRSSKK